MLNKNKRIKNRRSEEVSAGNLQPMLDCLGQGFFMFDPNGICLPIHSKACLELLEGNPNGLHVAAYLRSDPDLIARWIAMLFKETLPFEDLRPLGPSHFPHSNRKIIELDYQPVRNESDEMTYIIVIATDRTAEEEAKKVAELERGFFKLVLSISENRNQFIRFLAESKEILSEMKNARLSSSVSPLPTLLRGLHTLKGGAGLFYLTRLKDIAHHHEELLNQVKQRKKILATDLVQFDSGILAIEREFAEVVKKFHPLIGNEFEMGKSILNIEEADALDFYQKLKASSAGRSELLPLFADRFLHEAIERSFSSYNELVAQASDRLGKKVEPISFKGGEFRLNPRPYRRLFGSFVHAFRNAVDHGIETPDERIEAGKSEAGSITVEFKEPQINGVYWLSISIHDDGRGIHPEKIRKKLKTFKADHILLKAEDSELIQVLFETGFSTQESVSEWSGRGVGLDAILIEAKKMKGTARIKSVLGQGSTLTVAVPLVH